jgi:hypothetical protein
MFGGCLGFTDQGHGVTRHQVVKALGAVGFTDNLLVSTGVCGVCWGGEQG